MKPKYILSLILTIFIISACKKDNSEDAPIAEFSMRVPTGSKDSIYFMDKSINATSWRWDFGDTTAISIERNPSHKYEHYTISHNVTLTVSNSAGQKNTIQHTTSVPF